MSLKINKGAANTVVLTLTEKTTLSTPYYAFKFTNSQTQEEKIFNATDTSCDTTRFNKFVITEDSTEDLDDGTVELENPHQWYYTVYEVATATSKLTTGVELESGYVYVVDTESAVTSYTKSENIKAYEP